MTESELHFALVRQMAFLFAVERNFKDANAPVIFCHSHNGMAQLDEKRVWVEFYPTIGQACVCTIEARGTMRDVDEVADVVSDYAVEFERHRQFSDLEDPSGEDVEPWIRSMSDDNLRRLLDGFR